MIFRKLFLFFVFLSSLATVYSDNISSCLDDPNSSGLWQLNQSINISSGNCLVVASNDVVIDCQGFSINGNLGSNGEVGIYSNGYNNLTVTNCNINYFSNGTAGDGLYVDGSDYVQIINTDLSQNYRGLNIRSVQNSSFLNMNIINNSYVGVNYESGEYNNFTNIVSNYNNVSGMAIDYGRDSIFRNVEVNYNGNDGIFFSWNARNNQFYGLDVKFNVDDGIVLTRDANNNSFNGGDFRSNGDHNLVFSGTYGDVENTYISQVYIGNYSKIYANYNFTSLNNTLSGNYFDDFNSSIHPPYCYTVIPGTYSFCDFFAALEPTPSFESSASIFPLISFYSILAVFIVLIFS